MAADKDNLFGILKGDKIVDLELEWVALDAKISSLEKTISDNDWWDSRKTPANNARKRLLHLQKQQQFFEDFVEDLAKWNKLENDGQYYHQDLFKDYRWVLTIKKKV